MRRVLHITFLFTLIFGIVRAFAQGDQFKTSSQDSLSVAWQSLIDAMHQPVVTWPNVVQSRYTERRPPNMVSPLSDTLQFGGVRGGSRDEQHAKRRRHIQKRFGF